MSLIVWPSYLKFIGAAPHLSVPTASGGRSLTGGEKIIRGSAGFWQFGMDCIIRDHADRNKLQEIMARADGRAGVFQIPFCMSSHGPLGQLTRNYEPQPHSDASFFSNGTGYSANLLDVHTIEDVVEGGRIIKVTEIEPYSFASGHWITAENIFYRIQTAVKEADNTWTLTVQGTIKKAIKVGGYVEVDHPYGLFRFTDDEQGRMPVTSERSYEVRVEFEEARPWHAGKNGFDLQL